MKTPIALLLNDIHVSKDNIEEFQKNWNEMLSVAKWYYIKDIIIGGDMFTSRASQTLPVLLAVQNALRLAAKEHEIFIATGNHDRIDPESVDSYCHLYSDIPNVTVIDEYRFFWWEGCDYPLLVMSYFPENGSFVERLERIIADNVKDSKKRYVTLYIHEGVHGALGDFDIPNEVPQEALSGFKAVLCGHYHNRTKIKGTNIEYIGSSRQHNFGEDEEKGYTLLYDDGSYEFAKNKANIRYKTVEIGADDLDRFSFDKNLRYEYKLKVKVKCTETQSKNVDKQKLIELGANKVEVIVSDPTESQITPTGISEKYDRHGIRKEYQNYCNEQSIDSKLGLKYLED